MEKTFDITWRISYDAHIFAVEITMLFACKPKFAPIRRVVFTIHFLPHCSTQKDPDDQERNHVDVDLHFDIYSNTCNSVAGPKEGVVNSL